MPDSAKSQSINHQSPAPIGKSTPRPGRQHILHSINSRPPVILIQIASADENSEDLDLVRCPIKETGGSCLQRHKPSQRPLDFDRFNFAPEPFSNNEKVSNTARMERSEPTISEVSSGYCVMGDNGAETPGRERPVMAG